MAKNFARLTDSKDNFYSGLWIFAFFFSFGRDFGSYLLFCSDSRFHPSLFLGFLLRRFGVAVASINCELRSMDTALGDEVHSFIFIRRSNFWDEAKRSYFLGGAIGV